MVSFFSVKKKRHAFFSLRKRNLSNHNAYSYHNIISLLGLALSPPADKGKKRQRPPRSDTDESDSDDMDRSKSKKKKRRKKRSKKTRKTSKKSKKRRSSSDDSSSDDNDGSDSESTRSAASSSFEHASMTLQAAAGTTSCYLSLSIFMFVSLHDSL